MAHFAELDNNNVVLRVIVIDNSKLLVKGKESEAKGIEFCKQLLGGYDWKQTSYSKSFRGKFAGIGDIYDSVKDEFIAQ